MDNIKFKEYLQYKHIDVYIVFLNIQIIKKLYIFFLIQLSPKFLPSNKITKNIPTL